MLIAGTLLLTVIGLTTLCLQTVNLAWTSGQARVDNTNQLRGPLEKMLSDLRGGFNISVTDLDSTTHCNSVTFQNQPTQATVQTTYRLDPATHAIMRDVANGSGNGSFTLASSQPFTPNIALLVYGPQYEVDPSAGPSATPTTTWTPYALPVPNPSASTTDLPILAGTLPRGALLTVRLVGMPAPGVSALDVTTSVGVRN